MYVINSVSRCRATVPSKRTTSLQSTKCSSATTPSPTSRGPSPPPNTTAAPSPPTLCAGSTTHLRLPPCSAATAPTPPDTSTAVLPTSKSSPSPGSTPSSQPTLPLNSQNIRRNTCSTCGGWRTSSLFCSSTERQDSRNPTTVCSREFRLPRTTPPNTGSSTPSCGCAQCIGRWLKWHPTSTAAKEFPATRTTDLLIIIFAHSP